MKVRLYCYQHTDNGLTLQVIPETEAEAALLEALWKHGHMETGYTSTGPTSQGYLVTAFNLRPT